MQFNEWLRYNETTLNDLYQSAVAAFPNTTKRQHATQPIRITELTWTPFVGVKTLFVKGKATNEDRSYQPMILFKGVQYHKNGNGLVEITVDGKGYFLEKLDYARNDVLLRCNCPDFSWRFSYEDWTDRSLYGNKRKKYESKGGPPANPSKMPGMCKHLMVLASTIGQTGLLEIQ